MHGPNELDPTLAALAEGQRVFGRFTLVRALGRGTLGVVWMARDEAQNRDVELKFLPEVLARDVVTVADLKLEAPNKSSCLSRTASAPDMAKKKVPRISRMYCSSGMGQR